MCCDELLWSEPPHVIKTYTPLPPKGLKLPPCSPSAAYRGRCGTRLARLRISLAVKSSPQP